MKNCFYYFTIIGFGYLLLPSVYAKGIECSPSFSTSTYDGDRICNTGRGCSHVLVACDKGLAHASGFVDKETSFTDATLVIVKEGGTVQRISVPKGRIADFSDINWMRNNIPGFQVGRDHFQVRGITLDPDTQLYDDLNGGNLNGELGKLLPLRPVPEGSLPDRLPGQKPGRGAEGNQSPGSKPGFEGGQKPGRGDDGSAGKRPGWKGEGDRSPGKKPGGSREGGRDAHPPGSDGGGSGGTKKPSPDAPSQGGLESYLRCEWSGDVSKSKKMCGDRPLCVGQVTCRLPKGIGRGFLRNAEFTEQAICKAKYADKGYEACLRRRQGKDRFFMIGCTPPKNKKFICPSASECAMSEDFEMEPAELGPAGQPKPWDGPPSSFRPVPMPKYPPVYEKDWYEQQRQNAEDNDREGSAGVH